jgi:transcriptional regulator with XRE-family HTH domain
VREEEAEVKAWLRTLRRAAGLSQSDVAAAVGVSTRTVHNAEKAGAGMPAGLTLLRMLREYGAVADAPVAESHLEQRLRSLEDAVRQVAELTRETIALLADDQPADADPRARRRGS